MLRDRGAPGPTVGSGQAERLSLQRIPAGPLPSDHPYLKNVEHLWAHDPELAGQIESDDLLYPVEPTRGLTPAGAAVRPLTISLADESGRPVLIHSRYDPVAESARLVESAISARGTAGLVRESKSRDPGLCYVLGLGLGHHVRALALAAGPQTPIIVFEPDVRLIRTALFHYDFGDLLRDRRLQLVPKIDHAILSNRLTSQLILFSAGTLTVELAPSVRLAPEFYEQVRQWLAEFASFARTSLNTFLLNSALTAENIARNVGWYATSPGIDRLKDRFAGKPAVIVSAGPSLRKNQHLLPSAKDRAVLIAVQTTLQPLVQMGVEPHFVTSLDYHEISTRFFENLPKDRPLNVELVAEPKATSAIFGMLGGGVSLLGNEYAESLLREMNLNKSRLKAGATVAHLAFYLAEHLGCDPIIFLGQDLGFSDGLCYAPGTSYEDVWRPEFGRFCTPEMKQWDQIVRERFILRRIPDQSGRPMYTEERLFSYLQQFEKDFLQSQRTIIDATEGGAAKRGTTIMAFSDALDRYCQTPFSIDLSDHPGRQADRLPECRRSLELRREEAGRIAEVSGQTLALLEELRDHLHDQDRVNRLIARIDRLRAQMNELGQTYDLVVELAQSSQIQRFEADRAIGAAQLDPTEKQRRQVERDLANVRSVKEAAGRFAQLMQNVLDSDMRQQ